MNLIILSPFGRGGATTLSEIMPYSLLYLSKIGSWELSRSPDQKHTSFFKVTLIRVSHDSSRFPDMSIHFGSWIYHSIGKQTLH